MTHYCREVKTRRNISDQLTQTSDNHLNTTTSPKCTTVGNMTNLKIFDNKMPKAPGKDMEWASVAGMGFQLTLVRAAGGSGCWWVGLVGSGDLSATTTHRPPVRSRFLAPPPPPPPPPPTMVYGLSGIHLCNAVGATSPQGFQCFPKQECVPRLLLETMTAIPDPRLSPWGWQG